MQIELSIIIIVLYHELDAMTFTGTHAIASYSLMSKDQRDEARYFHAIYSWKHAIALWPGCRIHMAACEAKPRVLLENCNGAFTRQIVT